MAVLTGTTAKRNAWIEWLDRCRGGQFVNQSFFGKNIGGVPDVWASAIVALEKALQAGGYTPKSAWAYNFRGIGGATCTCSNFSRCSLHGNGIAIDIDPRLNPLIRTSAFRWSDTAFTQEQIFLVERIRNTKGEQLWSWGGRWNTVKDYMHFEANVDPGSTDVDWITVPGEGEQGDEDMDQVGKAVVDIAFDMGWASGDRTYWYGKDNNDPELEDLRAAIRAGAAADRVKIDQGGGGGGDLSRGDTVTLS